MESRTEKKNAKTKKKEGTQEGKREAFLSLRLSLVQAGIFILPGENANHQSQAACYVSV